MTTQRAIRLGLIGFGGAGETQYLAAETAPSVKIVAVAESNLRAGQRTMIDVPVHDDWQRLLDDKTLDAVTICLPHHLHGQVTLASLQAGKTAEAVRSLVARPHPTEPGC